MAMGNGGGGGGGARGVRMGAAYIELSAKDGITKHLKAIGSKFAEFGKMALGATGIGGLAGGLLGGLGFKDTIGDLSKMKTTIDALGMSTTGGSGLFGVLGQFSDMSENIEGLTQLSNAIQDTLAHGDKASALFDGLSVSAKDLAGVPLDEQFLRIHEAILQLPKDQQAYKLGLVGGTDSMKKWLPLLSMSNEELREQAKNLSFGSAELKDAADANKALSTAGAAVNRIWQQAAIAIAPLVTEGAKFVSDVLKPVTEWTKGRTLADVWDEANARLLVIWEEMKQHGRIAVRDTMNVLVDTATNLPESLRGVWKDMWGGMVTGAAGAVIQVEAVFNALLAKMQQGARMVFMKVAEAAMDPRKAAELLAVAPLAPLALGAEGIKQAMDAVGPEIAKLGMGTAFELDKLKNAALDAINVAKGQQELDAAKENLRNVMDRIEAARQGRRADGEAMPPSPLQQKLASIGRSLIVTGPAQFLKQAYSVRSADNPTKQLLDVNKKQAASLGEIKDILAKGKPMIFLD